MYVIKANGTVVYDQSRPGQWSVVGPRISQDLNQPGEFQFLLVPVNDFYNTCQPMETFISVEDDREEIFYGRVLTRSEPIFKGQVTVTCEGALSFLLDGELPPDPKKTSGSGYNHQTQTAIAFLERCLAAYRADIGNDSWRSITLGTVSHSKRNNTKEFKITSYIKAKSAIENQILDEFGGFIRIRKGQNGTHVLDWVEQFDQLNSTTIALGENVIEQTNRITGENLFTVIRPIGKDGLMLPNNDSREWMNSDGTMRVYTASDINQKYGRIVNSVTFSDADTDAKLYAAAHEYVEKLHYTLFANAEIKLVDFHYLDGTTPKVRPGWRFNNIYGFEGVELTVATLEMALENPEEGTITLKNGKELESVFGGMGENRSSSSAGSTSGRSLSGGLGGGYGTKFKYIHEFDERLQLATKDIQINADRLTVTGNELVQLSRKVGTEGDTIIDDTVFGKIRQIQGTGVFQNSEHITSLAGKFLVDDQSGKIILDSGTQLELSDTSGATIVVGDRLAQLTQDVTEYKGSALWTQRDSITGFVGSFDVDTSGGQKRLIVKDGAGLFIRENGVEQGVYTEGSLTGGVIIRKINGNSVETAISGDKISLSGNNEFSTVSSTVGSHTQSLNNLNGTITDTILGSTFWQTKDTISNVVGEFEYATDAYGNTSLVVKNGSAFKLRRNNTEWGLYDEGNLDGGIIINKINNDETGMTIKASKVDIKASDLATLGIYTEDHFDAGFIAERLDETVDGQNKTLAKIISDTVEIDASQVDLSNVDFINLVNNNSGTTRINANRINLDGYLAVKNLGSEFTNLGTANIDQLTAKKLYVAPVYGMGGVDLANAFTTGLISGQSLRFINPNSKTVTFSVANNTLTITDTEGATLTFKKAATLTSQWSGTSLPYVFTAKDEDDVVRARTSLDSIERGAPTASSSGKKYVSLPIELWFDYVEGEDRPTYSFSTTLNVNAAIAYNNGWAEACEYVAEPPAAAENTEVLTFTVGKPSDTVDQASSTGMVFTMSKGIPGTSGYATVSQGGHAVGRIDISNWYTTGKSDGETAGKNAVKITKGAWANGVVKFNKSTGSSDEKEVRLTAAAATWDGNVASVRIWDGTAADAKHGVDTGYTVTVNATSLVNAARTAGKNDVTVKAITWDSNTDNKSSTRTMTVSTNGRPTESTIPYAMVLQDDGNDAVILKANNSQVMRYAHNKYTAGVTAGTTAGKNAVTIVKGTWANGVVTFSKSEGTASNKEVRLTAAAATWSGNTASVRIWDGTAADAKHGTDTGYTVTVNATSLVNAARTAGKNAVTIVKGTWSGGKITFSKSEGTASNKTVQLTAAAATWNGNVASVRIWDGTAADAKHGVDTGYTVTVNATSLVNAARTAGKNDVTVKAITWDSNTDNKSSTRTMTVSTNGRPTESTIPYAMVLQDDGNDAVILKASNSQVMRYAHNKYTAGVTAGTTAGQNAVTIVKGTWANGVVTFSKSEGTASNKTVQLTAADATWNDNTASVRIWDGTAADAQHGTDTGYTVTVNATSLVNAARTAGKNAVTIVKGTWSGGKITFSKSEGTASNKTVQLTAAAATWDGNTASVRIWDGTAADAKHGVDTKYTVSVNATARYEAGQANPLKSAMDLSNASWKGTTKPSTGYDKTLSTVDVVALAGTGYVTFTATAGNTTKTFLVPIKTSTDNWYGGWNDYYLGNYHSDWAPKTPGGNSWLSDGSGGTTKGKHYVTIPGPYSGTTYTSWKWLLCVEDDYKKFASNAYMNAVLEDDVLHNDDASIYYGTMGITSQKYYWYYTSTALNKSNNRTVYWN